MARTVIHAPKQQLFFVVDSSVGPGCPNVRDDVFLVQFYLAALREDVGTNRGYRPANQGPIAVDGLFGAQTAAYINFFQQETNRRNPGKTAVREDNRVDPVASGRPISDGSGTLYTVLAFNAAYRQRFGSGIANNIRLDPRFPQELTKSLYLS